MESINKLLKSETDYNVYPGHGKQSTRFHEIKNNPYYIKNKRV